MPRYVLGIDAGGSKTVALLADETGRVLGQGRGGGANLKTHGELEVEKVFHRVIEEASGQARAVPEALALGVAGADRPEDHAILREILRRIGFRERVLVTNDAHIALVAGSASRVGLALICGTGSIAWGRSAGGRIARSSGWGWHLGDEGSGFWIGMRAIQAVLRGSDGRGPATALAQPVFEHFAIARIEEMVRVVYDGDFPRARIARLAPRVAAAAEQGDAAAAAIMESAASELASAAASVIRTLGLDGGPYDIVLAGGTFGAVPALVTATRERLPGPPANVRRLEEEPAVGAVKLAMEQIER